MVKMSEIKGKRCPCCIVHGKRGDYHPKMNSASIQDYSKDKKTWKKIGYYCKHCEHIEAIKGVVKNE